MSKKLSLSKSTIINKMQIHENFNLDLEDWSFYVKKCEIYINML